MSESFHRSLAGLEGERFDVLIIGAGISGATLAWDACLRGLRVALVDKGDFGAATSSATSKLIHGGLRYLKNGEIGLVRESLAERRILQAIAPHLVWPLPFMIPTYKTGNVKWMIKAGMLAYDVLSFDRNKGMDDEHHMPNHRSLSPDGVLKLEPSVNPEGLTGGSIYYDGQCFPERLTLEFILGARQHGAVCLNYAQARSVLRRQGDGARVEIVDLLDGQTCEVEARMVVNVGGPWADEVDDLFGTGDEVQLVRSKGIHIVTRAVNRSHALVLRTAAGRHFFVIPWRGHSLIGTTDTRYDGDVADLAATDEDVSTFIDEINGALPSAGLTMDDVLYRYAGVRPLVEQDTQVYQASRKYEIVDHHRRGHRGFISAVGGKYTTSRNLAEKLTDRILIHLDRPAVRCLTERRLLPGGMAGRLGDFIAAQVAEYKGRFEADVVENLAHTYGTRMKDVIGLTEAEPALAERLRDGRPEIMAQLAFAVRREQALTLCDALVRRTGAGTLGHPGDEALGRAAALVGDLLGWDTARREREQQIYAGKVLGRPEPAWIPNPPADRPSDADQVGAEAGGSAAPAS